MLNYWLEILLGLFVCGFVVGCLLGFWSSRTYFMDGDE